MKNIIIVILAAFGMFLFAACSKAGMEKETVSKDMTQPGPVSNVKVDNLNGAAIITYRLPGKMSNILYVQADYIINDKTGAKRQGKSSYYSDTLIVEGFAESKDYDVELKVVSRAGVASTPVVVKVRPEKPPYKLVRETLGLEADFAGVAATAVNTLKKNMGIVIIYDDPGYGRYVIRDQNFSNFEKVSLSSRGLDTLPKRMGAYVVDPFGNISDTLFKVISPLYEVALDRSKHFPYVLPLDKPVYAGSYTVNRIWNSVFGSDDCWHTDVLSGPNAVYPYTCTFGLGGANKVKLSRFTFWGRGIDARMWGGENPKVFSVWGSDKTQPADATMPMGVAEGTVVGDWVNLGNYRYPDPPSGNNASPGTITASDRTFWNAGYDFLVPINAPAVKFIRVSVEETWGKNNYAAITEMRFYGDPR